MAAVRMTAVYICRCSQPELVSLVRNRIKTSVESKKDFGNLKERYFTFVDFLSSCRFLVNNISASEAIPLWEILVNNGRVVCAETESELDLPRYFLKEHAPNP